MSVRVCVLAGAPGVLALIVIGNVPSGVLRAVPICRFTETGFPLVGKTLGDG